MKDFIPIALCNILCKIFFKALASRFKRVFRKINVVNQSAFVLGRLITNNFIVAFKTIYELKQSSRSNSGSCALKKNIIMAYDLVN